MKKLLLVLALGGAAFLGYTHFVSPDLSAVEQRLADLEDQLDDARTRAGQAYRTASLSGVDSTSEVEAARQGVVRIKQSLASCEKQLDSDAARRRARRLTEAIAAFERELR
jgi:hypothetical protein